MIGLYGTLIQVLRASRNNVRDKSWKLDLNTFDMASMMSVPCPEKLHHVTQLASHG